MTADANSIKPASEGASPFLVRMGPGVFVVLWSTGFIGAKLGAPYAEPFSFLGIRFFIAASIMLVIAFTLKATWPENLRGYWETALVGILVHGTYLGGVFWAIDRGLAAGTSALIVSVYPLLVGVLAGTILGEKVSGRHWLGLVLGFIGVAMVVWDQVQIDPEQWTGVGACVLSLFGVTAGTLIHKRLGTQIDLSASQAIQLGAAGFVLAVLAFVFETRTITWSGEFIFAMSWLVIVLSLGGFTLLLSLIRNGAASKVSSLFYLVPPCTAVTAYLLFGETLGQHALAGILVAAAGVALVTRKQATDE